MTQPTSSPAHISLIATVMNEASAIGRLLESISAQSRPPDEVVFADGGSHDGTPALIEAWGARQAFPVRVFSVPGANISQGRNAAIRVAAGPWIASTDAGVRLDPHWLAQLAAGAPANISTSQPEVVSGFFVPDAHNPFEMAMSATVLPVLSDINPQTFLPSSRSILFRKSAWEAVGGYPEWLDYCEDLLFDFALKARAPFAFAPQAIAYFRPRGTLRSFFRQYYLYARGDGKANLFLKRHLIRYASYLVGLPFLLALCFVAPPLGPLCALLGLLIGGAAYTRTPYRRLRPYIAHLSRADALYAVALVPLIRVVGDLAKMIGYPVGVWWRLRNDGRRKTKDGR